MIKNFTLLIVMVLIVFPPIIYAQAEIGGERTIPLPGPVLGGPRVRPEDSIRLQEPSSRPTTVAQKPPCDERVAKQVAAALKGALKAFLVGQERMIQRKMAILKANEEYRKGRKSLEQVIMEYRLNKVEATTVERLRGEDVPGKISEIQPARDKANFAKLALEAIITQLKDCKILSTSELKEIIVSKLYEMLDESPDFNWIEGGAGGGLDIETIVNDIAGVFGELSKGISDLSAKKKSTVDLNRAIGKLIGIFGNKQKAVQKKFE